MNKCMGLQVVGLAYDPVKRKVFWGTNGKIMEAPLEANSLPKEFLYNGEFSMIFSHKFLNNF